MLIFSESPKMWHSSTRHFDQPQLKTRNLDISDKCQNFGPFLLYFFTLFSTPKTVPTFLCVGRCRQSRHQNVHLVTTDRTVSIWIKLTQCKPSKTPKNRHKNHSFYNSSSTAHIDRSKLVSLNAACKDNTNMKFSAGQTLPKVVLWWSRNWWKLQKIPCFIWLPTSCRQ